MKLPANGSLPGTSGLRAALSYQDEYPTLGDLITRNDGYLQDGRFTPSADPTEVDAAVKKADIRPLHSDSAVTGMLEDAETGELWTSNDPDPLAPTARYMLIRIGWDHPYADGVPWSFQDDSNIQEG